MREKRTSFIHWDNCVTLKHDGSKCLTTSKVHKTYISKVLFFLYLWLFELTYMHLNLFYKETIWAHNLLLSKFCRIRYFRWAAYMRVWTYSPYYLLTFFAGPNNRTQCRLQIFQNMNLELMSQKATEAYTLRLILRQNSKF